MMPSDLADLWRFALGHMPESLGRQMGEIGGLHRVDRFGRKVGGPDRPCRAFLDHFQTLIVFGSQQHQRRAAMAGDYDWLAPREVREFSQPFLKITGASRCHLKSI